MYCPDCGHNNPDGNKFCGMCGEPLPARRASKSFSAGNAERQRTAEKNTERRERIADHDPEPVAASLRHRERVDEPVRVAHTEQTQPVSPKPGETRVGQPAATTTHREENRYPISGSLAEAPVRQPLPIQPLSSRSVEPAKPVEEPATTLSGPSFLGLSSGSGESGSYSYLYEDEAPKSHAPLVVFLLCLAVLGGVLYWQWQPIQNWVINRANQKVDTGAPAPTSGSSTASSDNTSTPPGQAGQPANAAPSGGNPAATPSTQTPNQTPSIQQPNASPDNSARPKNAQPDNKPKADENAAPPTNEDESKAEEPEKPAPESTAGKTSAAAARRQVAPQPPAGADLVASGEKYLYGRGVPQNCGHAINDFNNAARQDNARAMAHLGALYATGECVPLNRVQAYQWFSRALAKDRSNTYLEHNMSMLWREMDANEKAQVGGQAETARSKMF